MSLVPGTKASVPVTDTSDGSHDRLGLIVACEYYSKSLAIAPQEGLKRG